MLLTVLNHFFRMDMALANQSAAITESGHTRWAPKYVNW